MDTRLRPVRTMNSHGACSRSRYGVVKSYPYNVQVWQVNSVRIAFISGDYLLEPRRNNLPPINVNNKVNNMITNKADYDAAFSGIIGEEYELLNLICPAATEMSRLLGLAVSDYPQESGSILSIVELGGGTGITTLSLLNAKDKIHIVSVDNEPVMQNQAKKHLQRWVDEEKLAFCGDDALTALINLASETVDLVVSAYSLHNFLNDYREAVIKEIFRVLKQGGALINADRYALDDVSEHTHCIQQEVSRYFKVLTGINRIDLLEHWILHLFSDESENHVMRETISINQMRNAGFSDITVTHRHEVNAMIKAIKPMDLTT